VDRRLHLQTTEVPFQARHQVSRTASLTDILLSFRNSQESNIQIPTSDVIAQDGHLPIDAHADTHKAASSSSFSLCQNYYHGWKSRCEAQKEKESSNQHPQRLVLVHKSVCPICSKSLAKTVNIVCHLKRCHQLFPTRLPCNWHCVQCPPGVSFRFNSMYEAHLINRHKKSKASALLQSKYYAKGWRLLDGHVNAQAHPNCKKPPVKATASEPPITQATAIYKKPPVGHCGNHSFSEQVKLKLFREAMCPVCFQLLGTNHDLVSHLTQTHQYSQSMTDQVIASVPLNWFCVDCPERSFQYSSSYAEHLMAKHKASQESASASCESYYQEWKSCYQNGLNRSLNRVQSDPLDQFVSKRTARSLLVEDKRKYDEQVRIGLFLEARCPVCFLKVVNDQLAFHMKRNHQYSQSKTDQVIASVPLNWFCAECPKRSFQYSSSYAEHLMAKHKASQESASASCESYYQEWKASGGSPKQLPSKPLTKKSKSKAASLNDMRRREEKRLGLF
jgi:hypothetical protein